MKSLFLSLIAQTSKDSTQQPPENSGELAHDAANQSQEIFTKITGTKIFQALIILVLAYVVIRVVDWLVTWLSEKVAKERRLQVKQFQPFVRTFVITITIITLMNLFLRLSQENVLAVTGTVAVALGFAFKDYVSSIIAGIIGLFEAPYKVGDRIEIDDEYGEVMSYGLRGIRLRTPSDDVVTVPHNYIWTNSVSNANMGELEAQVVTEFFLAHEADPDLVKHILYRIAHTSKFTHLGLPIVVVMSEESWGSLYKLKCYPIDAREEFLYQTDLTIRAKKMFAKHRLPYPKRLNFVEKE